MQLGPIPLYHYRCLCGDSESWGSDAPAPCRGCAKCHTTLETHPDLHRTPEPHNWAVTMVDTDYGPQPLTRCLGCGRRKPFPEMQTRGHLRGIYES